MLLFPPIPSLPPPTPPATPTHSVTTTRTFNKKKKKKDVINRSNPPTLSQTYLPPYSFSAPFASSLRCQPGRLPTPPL